MTERAVPRDTAETALVCLVTNGSHVLTSSQAYFLQAPTEASPSDSGGSNTISDGERGQSTKVNFRMHLLRFLGDADNASQSSSDSIAFAVDGVTTTVTKTSTSASARTTATNQKPTMVRSVVYVAIPFDDIDHFSQLPPLSFPTIASDVNGTSTGAEASTLISKAVRQSVAVSTNLAHAY